MMDMAEELRDISRLIGSAALIDSVRREVCRAVGSVATVLDGEHHEAGCPFQVVVRLPSGEKARVAARRIRGAFPDVDVKALADGVLGVRQCRRGRQDGL